MKRMKKGCSNKKWIGAAISAATAIGSSIINAQTQKKQNEALDAANLEDTNNQKIQQNKIDTLKQATAYSNTYNTQGYVDDYKKKLTFKKGGSIKKKEAGGSESSNELISNILGGVGSLVSSGVNASSVATPTAKEVIDFNPVSTGTTKDSLVAPKYNTNSVKETVYNNMSQFKCGGSKRKIKSKR